MELKIVNLEKDLESYVIKLDDLLKENVFLSDKF